MTDDSKKIPTWAKREPLSKVEVVDRLNDMGSAAYACARATTDPDARAGYVDRSHAMREAARLLGA
jgi:hypothetical protein